MHQRLKQQQQQALMQQAFLQQQQQAMYQPGVITSMSQMEPVPSGNLPPGFDPSACCSVEARVTWDHKTGRSRGYGFVSFCNQQDAQNAINDLSGKWLGSRQIRCNWAVKGAGFSDDKQSDDNQNLVVLTNGSSSEGGQENTPDEAPENNPLYTTVYVGNLAHEVTQAELHRQFHMLGAGTIEEVRVQKDKGFGFVRYGSHEEASLAIQVANGKIICAKPIKENEVNGR